MARKKPGVDPNSDEAGDTQPLGDHSPRFPKLTPEDELNLLIGADAALAALPDHALDCAPENSKIVVVNRPEGTGRIAVVATPDGTQLLPAGDRAHLLPIGSRVYKAAEGKFFVRLPFEYADCQPKVGGRAAEVLELAVRAIFKEGPVELAG